MINQVSEAVSRATRAVVLKHPNSMECQVYRKVVKRTNPTGETMGGAPTLGGMGVLSSEDEPDFEYQPVGSARVLFSAFGQDLDIVDRDDGVALPVGVVAAQIEALDNTQFTPEKYDLLACMPGGGVLIGFEVVGLSTSINIYPYTRKYAVAPRDELHDLAPWSKR